MWRAVHELAKRLFPSSRQPGVPLRESRPLFAEGRHRKISDRRWSDAQQFSPTERVALPPNELLWRREQERPRRKLGSAHHCLRKEQPLILSIPLAGPLKQGIALIYLQGRIHAKT